MTSPLLAAFALGYALGVLAGYGVSWLLEWCGEDRP